LRWRIEITLLRFIFTKREFLEEAVALRNNVFAALRPNSSSGNFRYAQNLIGNGKKLEIRMGKNEIRQCH
jgi:hypothetical protein